MSIDAMKQALEALKEIHPGNMTPMAEEGWNKAITSLRLAIEQAERQERYTYGTPLLDRFTKQAEKQEPVAEIEKALLDVWQGVGDPRFPHIKAQPEPVAMRYDFDGYGYKYIDSGSGSNWQTRHKGAEPLYEAPPQRQPLTEEEFDKIENRVYCRTREKGKPLGVYVRELCRAIERAHGIGGGE